jgi:hypothetical protein
VSQSPMSSFFRRDDKKPTPSEFIDAVRKLVDCESLPSDKRANNIEAFLALCHQCQFQMDVLHSILTDQAARLAFLEFLRDEYYVGAYYYFEEAVGYLEYEINSNIGVAEDEANGLNLRRLTNHEYEVRKSRWRSSHNHCRIVHYWIKEVHAERILCAFHCHQERFRPGFFTHANFHFS